jgi:cobalt/nickel transport system permease protein
MKHSFLDLYREGTSPVHKLDPRVKFVATLAYIVSASLLPAGYWPGYLALLVLILAATLVASIPLRVAVGRSLVAVPFALMAAISLPFTRAGVPLASLPLGPWTLTVTAAGLEALATVLARAWLSVLAAGLLTATTPFSELLAALQSLGLPAVLAALISFLYRYIFVLVDEAQRLWRARESRSADVGPGAGGTVLWRARVLGGMIGSLFIRSYERSERVYQAMLARGFQGEIRSAHRRHLAAADVQIGLAFCLALAALIVSGHLPWWRR